ncbi:MAG: S-layer protein [Candidatus Woesearchaeota archaeon]|nr:S-layer protein [Candidatus Woesearchaeota archaeon]
MKLLKTIKKVAALGAGASMFGATMLGALAAADLSTYPDPFVKDGAFNALIVVGEAAATQDVLGAIDIATSLQYAAKTVSTVDTGSATSVSMSGDSKKVEKSSNKLEFNEAITGITESLTSSDLVALGGGTITNENGDYDYTETIYLPTDGKMQYTADPDDVDSVVKPYFVIANGAAVYRYKISFSPGLKSDHNTGSSGYLDDIKNKKITMLGKEYTIIKAAHSAMNNTELTFMAGAVNDVLEEGASKSYTLPTGDEYDVTLDFVGTTTAKFTVNNEVTTSLAEGDTFKLADGSEIGIVDIMAQAFAGGLRKAEFDIGANKIKIADSATQTAGSDATITVGSEELSSTKGDIVTSTDEGITHGSDVTITSIEVNYTAGQDLYLGEGASAADVADLAESQEGNFFTDSFDYKFEGLQIGATDEITLKPSGSYNYKLKFTNKAGVEYNQDVVNLEGADGAVTVGRYTGSAVRSIVMHENNTVADENYFVVSKGKYSRIMQFKDVVQGTSTSDNTGTIKILDTGTGSMHEVTYTGDALEGDLNLDGNTFKINISSDTNGGTIMVDLDGDGTRDDKLVNPELWTKGELNITLNCGGTSTTAQGGNICLTTEDDEDNQFDRVEINLYESSNKLDINDSLNNATWGSQYQPAVGMQLEEDGSNVYKLYTNYGMFISNDRKGTGSDTQNDMVITYPDEQAFGAFFVTSGATTATTSSGDGAVETTTVTKIDVGAAVLDTDPAVDGKEKTQNLIVVGGPAINKAAAVLLGKPFPSYGAASGIPENAAIVKLVEQTDGNVALVVAGWTAEDSQRASRVVADFETYRTAGTLTGMEVEVTGTSLSDITVSAPTVEEVVEEEAEEETTEAAE